MRYEGDERTGWKDNVNEGGIKEYSFSAHHLFKSHNREWVICSRNEGASLRGRTP
jgi:hypothetical protein